MKQQLEAHKQTGKEELLFHQAKTSLQMQQMVVQFNQNIMGYKESFSKYDVKQWAQVISSMEVASFYLMIKQCMEMTGCMNREDDKDAQEIARQRITNANERMTVECRIAEDRPLLHHEPTKKMVQQVIHRGLVWDAIYDEGDITKIARKYTFDYIQSLERWIMGALGIHPSIYPAFLCHRDTFPSWKECHDDVKDAVSSNIHYIFNIRRASTPFIWRSFPSSLYINDSSIPQELAIVIWSAVAQFHAMNTPMDHVLVSHLFRQWNIIMGTVKKDDVVDNAHGLLRVCGSQENEYILVT